MNITQKPSILLLEAIPVVDKAAGYVLHKGGKYIVKAGNRRHAYSAEEWAELTKQHGALPNPAEGQQLQIPQAQVKELPNMNQPVASNTPTPDTTSTTTPDTPNHTPDTTPDTTPTPNPHMPPDNAHVAEPGYLEEMPKLDDAAKAGIFATTSGKILFFGIAGISAAAIVAWIFRRQIIKAVWLKKLKNNATKVGKQIDAILVKNAKDVLLKKDEILKKIKGFEDQKKRTQDPGTIKRIDAQIQGLEKMAGDWDAKFVQIVESAVDTIVDGKTKELNLRIDGLQQLQPGQKLSLKTIWATMMINLKANGYKKLTDLKLVGSKEVLSRITADINKQSDELKQKVSKVKAALHKKYKTLQEIKIGNVSGIKYGAWYPYGENKYVRFVIDGDTLGESDIPNYVAEVVQTSNDKNTRKLSKKTIGSYKNQDELESIVAKAKITADTQTVDLDKQAQEAVANQTPEQKLAAEELAKKAKISAKNRANLRKALEDQARLEANGHENDPQVIEKRKKLFGQISKTLLGVALSVTAGALLKTMI